MFFLRFSGDWQSNRQVTRTTLNYAACLMFYLRFSGDWQSDRQVTWTTLNYAACLMFYLRFSGDWQSDRQVTWTTLNYAACLMFYLRFSGDWQSPSKPRIFAKHQCHVGSFQVQQILDCKGSIEHQKAYNPRVYVRAQLYLAYPSLKTLISSRRSFTRYCAQLLRMQFLLLRCTLMVIS